MPLTSDDSSSPSVSSAPSAPSAPPVPYGLPYGPQVHPYLTLVECDEHTLQMGVMQQEAVTIRLPQQYRADDVRWLLSRCDGTRSLAELTRIARTGDTPLMQREDFTTLLTELSHQGVAHLGFSSRPDYSAVHNKTSSKDEGTSPRDVACPPAIGIVGRGPFAQEIWRLCTASGYRPFWWEDTSSAASTVAAPADTDAAGTPGAATAAAPCCVVLAGTILPDPVLVQSLLDQNIPFILASIVDNRGLIGPVVWRASAPQVFGPLRYLPGIAQTALTHVEGRGSLATITASAAFLLSLISTHLRDPHPHNRWEQWEVTPDAGAVYRRDLRPTIRSGRRPIDG